MTWSESALSESALDDDASMRRSDVETAATPRSRSIAMGPLAAMWRRGALGRSSGDNGSGGGGGRGGGSGGGAPGASAGGGFRQVPSRLSRGSGQRRYVKDQEEEEEEVDPLGLNGRHLVEEGGAEGGGAEEGGAEGGGAEGRAAGAGKEGGATGGAEEVGAIRGGGDSIQQAPAGASGEGGGVSAAAGPDRQGAGVDGGAGTSGAAAVPQTEVEAADAAPPRSLPRKEAPKVKAKGATSPRKATRPAYLYLEV